MRIGLQRTLIITLLMIITLSISYAQNSHIATIVSSEGRVSIKPKATSRWDTNAVSLQLCAGDSVKTAKRSTAAILYSNGQEVWLGPQKSHLVAMVKKESIRSKIASVLEWLFEQEAPLEHGISRGADKPPVLIYPRYGKLLSNRPSFAWLSSAAGTEYVLQLFNEDDSLIWKSIQKDTVLNYPARAPQLSDSVTYQVEVSRRFKDGAEDYGNFSIASTVDRARMLTLQRQIKATYKFETTSDVVFAASLMKEEFFTEALLVLQEALKKQPDNRTIRTMLAQIYEQVGPPLLINPMLK